MMEIIEVNLKQPIKGLKQCPTKVIDQLLSDIECEHFTNTYRNQCVEWYNYLTGQNLPDVAMSKV